MKTESKVRRRDFLRALGAGAGVAATGSAALVEQAAAEGDSGGGKRGYQANSPEVQTYYRVNRYPTNPTN